MKFIGIRIEIDTIWIGVGGTATIDFGIGACSQLGLKLFNEIGNPIAAVPKNFEHVDSVLLEKVNLPFKINCVVDVETPLIGNPGAIEIYGEQKGGTKEDIELIKNGINNLINLLSQKSGIKILDKLNGAGGGLAAGLNLLFNAEIIPAELFIRNYLLNEVNLSEVDAVITGEGIFDSQSFEGKGSGILLKLFKDRSIPIFLINGSTNLPLDRILPKNVTNINMIDFFSSKEESIKNFKIGIDKSVQIVRNHLNY